MTRDELRALHRLLQKSDPISAVLRADIHEIRVVDERLVKSAFVASRMILKIRPHLVPYDYTDGDSREIEKPCD